VIPLRDDVPSRTTPFVTWFLIALNVLAFLYELTLGEGIGRFFFQAAVVPSLYTGENGALDPLEALLTTFDPDLGGRVLASMFLHGGWAHIIGNMLYMWIFGDNVEDRLGHGRFGFFYLFTGWVASYSHIWASPTSAVPSIGASGAVAGVLGAYLVLYPRAQVVALLPLGILMQLVRVPAFLLLVLWFVQQFFAGALSLAARTAQTGGVAWWAHIGGFVAGLVLVRLLARPERRPREPDRWWDDRLGRRRV
jgi:membrane associated rhomboid family serine protease